MTNVLLNNIDHHDLRVITRHGAEFGDGINQVMVFPTEFESAGREYPIVFRKDRDGALRPAALLGLDRDENLFLDGAGGWQARYVPALRQRGPFSIAAPENADGEPMIRIDPDHPRVSRSEGAPLFLQHGGNSPYLEHVTEVLRTIYIGHHQVEPMLAAFDAAALLRPVKLEMRVSESELFAVSDVLTIDEERLAALDGAALEALHRAGFLRAAFLAAASLANVGGLIERKNRQRAAA
ncbi:MAG: SapC family protein [Sphingomonas sp.]